MLWLLVVLFLIVGVIVFLLVGLNNNTNDVSSALDIMTIYDNLLNQMDLVTPPSNISSLVSNAKGFRYSVLFRGNIDWELFERIVIACEHNFFTTNWWIKEIEIPIQICKGLHGVNATSDHEKNLLDRIFVMFRRWCPDPFLRTTSLWQETYSNLFNKLIWYYIMLNITQTYNLTSKRDDDESLKTRIIERCLVRFHARSVRTLHGTNGFYQDGSFVFDTDIPSIMSHGAMLFDCVVYMKHVLKIPVPEDNVNILGKNILLNYNAYSSFNVEWGRAFTRKIRPLVEYALFLQLAYVYPDSANQFDVSFLKSIITDEIIDFPRHEEPALRSLPIPDFTNNIITTFTRTVSGSVGVKQNRGAILSNGLTGLAFRTPFGTMDDVTVHFNRFNIQITDPYEWLYSQQQNSANQRILQIQNVLIDGELVVRGTSMDNFVSSWALNESQVFVSKNNTFPKAVVRSYEILSPHNAIAITRVRVQEPGNVSFVVFRWNKKSYKIRRERDNLWVLTIDGHTIYCNYRFEATHSALDTFLEFITTPVHVQDSVFFVLGLNRSTDTLIMWPTSQTLCTGEITINDGLDNERIKNYAVSPSNFNPEYLVELSCKEFTVTLILFTYYTNFPTLIDGEPIRSTPYGVNYVKHILF